ncbi:MAG: choline monooxygenase [Planctomycetota bacterium]|jgi:choline monooxygenase
MNDDLFNPDQYQPVRKPLREASTLPPHCYTAEAFYRAEMERVFQRHWQFVGRVEQLPAAGDYRCVDAVGGPVILMRNGDSSIKAFANSCRHRGVRLLSGTGSCKRIVCPYHRWSYRLSGELMAAPDMDAIKHFDKADFPLIELPLQSWNGFIFINYQANPVPLSQQLGNLPELFASHRCDAMRLAGQLNFSIKANWKLLAENSLEAYHTGSVHRDTLGQQQSSPIDDTHGSWTGLLVEDETSVATMVGDDKPFEHIDGLDGFARKGAYFTLAYPATQLVFAQDCMWWLNFKPVAVDQTELEIGACFPQSTIERDDFKDKVAPYFERFQQATAEDNAICAEQQLGQQVNRPAGRFAPSEFAVHHFSNWVLDQVLTE